MHTSLGVKFTICFSFETVKAVWFRGFPAVYPNYLKSWPMDGFKALTPTPYELYGKTETEDRWMFSHICRGAVILPCPQLHFDSPQTGMEHLGRFERLSEVIGAYPECAGIFDICRKLRLVQEAQYMKGRELLITQVASHDIPSKARFVPGFPRQIFAYFAQVCQKFALKILKKIASSSRTP